MVYEQIIAPNFINFTFYKLSLSFLQNKLIAFNLEHEIIIFEEKIYYAPFVSLENNMFLNF